MKIFKILLIFFSFSFFTSNSFAQNYRIIFVYGPHSKKVSYDYYMQKGLYHLLRQLIAFSKGKIDDRIKLSKFCSSKKGFRKYRINSNAKRVQAFVDKKSNIKIDSKKEKIVFVSVGKGQRVVDRALEDFSNEYDEATLNNLVDSWQEILANKLFNKLNIKDNDELAVVKDFLIAFGQDSYVLNIDFNKLKTEARDFYKLLKKAGKLLQNPFSLFRDPIMKNVSK